MRKHVAPAHPGASIPDPDRGGFLPPEGRTVPWTPHWAGMAAREEIAVTDAPDEVAPEATDSTEAPAPVQSAAEPHEAHPDA